MTLQPAQNQNRINKRYTDVGLEPPKGKGLHTVAFHKRAIAIMKGNPDMPRDRAYAIAMKQLGRNKAVKTAHRNPEYRKEQYAKIAIGKGLGVGKPARQLGGRDMCVCSKCGHEQVHPRGIPCTALKCAKCGASMIGSTKYAQTQEYAKLFVRKKPIIRLKRKGRLFRSVAAAKSMVGKSGTKKYSLGLGAALAAGSGGQWGSTAGGIARGYTDPKDKKARKHITKKTRKWNALAAAGGAGIGAVLGGPRKLAGAAVGAGAGYVASKINQGMGHASGWVGRKLFKPKPKDYNLTVLQTQGKVPASNQLVKYSTIEALKSWRLGYQDGLAEAKGDKSPPGALGLGLRQAMYGNSYVLGRQSALTKHGRSGGTRSAKSQLEVLSEILKDAKSLPSASLTSVLPSKR